MTKSPRSGKPQAAAAQPNQSPRRSFRLVRLVYLPDPTAVAVIFALSGLPSLAALLHVGPDELLGVLLENLVDLVQDRVHVVSELVLPLPDLLAGLCLAFLLLLGAPGYLPLAAGVLG